MDPAKETDLGQTCRLIMQYLREGNFNALTYIRQRISNWEELEWYVSESGWREAKDKANKEKLDAAIKQAASQA